MLVTIDEMMMTPAPSKDARLEKLRGMAGKVVGEAFFGTLLRTMRNSKLRGEIGHGGRGYEVVEAQLQGSYGERMGSSTQKGTDRRLEFWVSDKGTWSMVLVLPNGRSCLKSSGPHPFTEKLRVAESPALPNAGETSSGRVLSSG